MKDLPWVHWGGWVHLDFVNFSFKAIFVFFPPELHYTAVATAFVVPKLPPESWEAGLPGTLGSPPAPEGDD